MNTSDSDDDESYTCSVVSSCSDMSIEECGVVDEIACDIFVPVFNDDGLDVDIGPDFFIYM